jgi:hypothetical protein
MMAAARIAVMRFMVVLLFDYGTSAKVHPRTFAASAKAELCPLSENQALVCLIFERYVPAPREAPPCAELLLLAGPFEGSHLPAGLRIGGSG